MPLQRGPGESVHTCTPWRLAVNAGRNAVPASFAPSPTPTKSRLHAPSYDPDVATTGEYNNRARVPGRPRRSSRSWTEGIPCTCGDACARGGFDIALRRRGRARRLDLFPTAAADSAPLFVFIHGGYWRSLDKSDTSFVAPALAQAGLTVVVPNYALCPSVTIEQITMQMVKAVAWTYRNATLYGGNPKRVYVGGHSAGGHLAVMMALCDWPTYAKGLPRDLVKGVLAISGLYDLEPVSRCRS